MTKLLYPCWGLGARAFQPVELEVSKLSGCDGKIKAALCGWSGVARHRSLSRFRPYWRRTLAQMRTVRVARAQCAAPQAPGFVAGRALCR